jgi:hypothetical protein
MLIKPTLYARTLTNRPELLGGETGLPDSGNTLVAGQFVVLTSGALVAVADGEVLSCGQVLDASKATTAIDPPYAMFGDRHFPLSLKGSRFAITVTDGSETLTEASGAPQLSEVTIGEKYGIKLVAGTGIHYLDVDNTTNDFFVVVEKPANFRGIVQTATTYNPVVIVEVIAAAIQDI